MFDSLLPYNKWKDEHPNLSVGETCAIKYENKVTKGDFRLCRVASTEVNMKGLVRTVDMRPRESRDQSLPYKSKKLTRLKVGTQDLFSFVPVMKLSLKTNY